MTENAPKKRDRRRLMTTRAPRGTDHGHRIRSLFRGYLRRLGPDHDPIIEAGALRAAELLVLAEDLRAKALAGDGVGINDITRLESTARRAEQDLFGKVEPPDPALDLPEYPDDPTESIDAE